MARQKLIHIHSNQLSATTEGIIAKAPSADTLEYGEIAVSYNEEDPSLFIKSSGSTGTVISKFSSDKQILGIIEHNEQVTSAALNNLQANKQDKLKAGTNITISSDNTISATDTKYNTATTTTDGLMSAADKTKLDGIASGATKVTESTVSGWGFTKNSGTVTTSGTMTSENVVISNGGSVIKDSGYTIGKSVPSNAIFTDTTYGLTSSDATVTLTPSSGSASSITVNNVAKATAADHVVSAVTFSAGTFGSNVSYSGNTTPTVNIPTRTSHLTNDSDFTTKVYVDGLVASPVNYKGAITNATLPASGSTKVGDLYIVQTSAITLTATQSATGAAQTAEPGDYVIARTRATWDVIQKNINNAVTGKDATAFGAGKIIVGTGSGQVVSASTFTIEKSVPSDAVFTDTNTKVTSVGNHYTPASSTTKSASANYAIAGIKMDAAGHVTEVVSSAHKVEKDVPSDAKFTDTVYTHPTYTSKTSGLYKITVDGTGHVNGTTAVTKSDITGLGIPGQDTDTHWTTGLKVGASSGATANATSSNGSTFINVLDNSTVRDSHLIKGTGKATVTSDANGAITINAAAGTYEETAGSGTATANSGYALSSVSLSAGHVLSKSAQIKIPSTPEEVGAAAVSHTHNYEPTSTAVRHTASTAVGSTTQPVYVDSTGKATAIGYTIAKNVPSDAKFTDTDTKNTAGSTDTGSKIFLVGATSQATNPQTYSDNEVYTTSGVLTTKSLQVGGGSATMQYDATNECIKFVFA